MAIAIWPEWHNNSATKQKRKRIEMVAIGIAKVLFSSLMGINKWAETNGSERNDAIAHRLYKQYTRIEYVLRTVYGINQAAIRIMLMD